MGKRYEEMFHQKGLRDGRQTHEKMFNIIREMKIKTTMRYKHTPIRKTKIVVTATKAGGDEEERSH